MKKVLTMTLNPCIDRTVYFDSFRVGETNIVKKVLEEAAGKGINVAVGLRHLKVPVKALGFAYKEDLLKLYGKLEKEGIPYSFVEVDGRLRVNQKLFDESKSEMTECNEKGSEVSKADVDKLLELLVEELMDASILVLSGSVPPGVDTDIYARMISMANEAGVKVILDASGELLRKGVKAKPYLIKPNKDEFVKTFLIGGEEKRLDKSDETKTNLDVCRNMESESDQKAEFENELQHIAGILLKEGVSYICLSMGADGARLMSLTEDETVTSNNCPAIPVQVRSLQGAGDAMVAGLCKAIYEGQEEKMLDYALAMAASTISLEGTQMGRLRL